MISGILAVQVAVAFVMLGIGSYHDLRTNTIPNKVWLIFGVLGAGVAGYVYGFSVLLGVHLIFGGLLAIAAYVAWRLFPEQFGGADAKAFMALGVILSAFSFVVLGTSFVCVEAYLVYKLFHDKLKPRQVLAVKFPYIPMLFAGLVFATVVALAGA